MAFIVHSSYVLRASIKLNCQISSLRKNTEHLKYMFSKTFMCLSVTNAYLLSDRQQQFLLRLSFSFRSQDKYQLNSGKIRKIPVICLFLPRKAPFLYWENPWNSKWLPNALHLCQDTKNMHLPEACSLRPSTWLVSEKIGDIFGHIPPVLKCL